MIPKRIRKVYDAATAGNATLTISPTTGKWMKVLSGHVIYTSDATVANRFVRITAKDADGNILCESHAGAAVTASLAAHLTYMQGVYRETSFVNNELQVPVSNEFLIPPDGTLEISADNGVVGDSFAAALLVEEE